MPRPELPNKPLVEAIFEAHWPVSKDSQFPIESGTVELRSVDPNYRLLPGKFSVPLAVLGFNYYEPIQPHTFMGNESLPHVVYHRYRPAKDQWPLVQLGPGILSYNDTHGYKWEPFSKRCQEIAETLVTAASPLNFPGFNKLQLRYIDAVEIRAGDSSNPWEFLRDRLHVNFGITGDVFQGQTADTPNGFQFQLAFRSNQPIGNYTLTLTLGKHGEVPAVILDFIVASAGEDLSGYQREDRSLNLEQWLTEAHDLCSHWFHTLIQGELQRRFEGNE